MSLTMEPIEQLAQEIFDGTNLALRDARAKDVLQVARDSLTSWKKLSSERGFQLVGVSVYLPEELAYTQRELLKEEFAKLGFEYDNVGENPTNINKNTVNTELKESYCAQGVSVSPHPEFEPRGTPLQKFYIDPDKLQKESNLSQSNDNKNDHKISLRFSPKMDAPKLKDKAVYKPGVKPSAPMPRMDLTIRPMRL